MLDRLHSSRRCYGAMACAPSIAEVLDAVRALEAVACRSGRLSAVRCPRRLSSGKKISLPSMSCLTCSSISRVSFWRQSEAPLVEALRRRGLSEDELERLLALIADQATRLDPTARMALGPRRNDLRCCCGSLGYRSISLDVHQPAADWLLHAARPEQLRWQRC